MAIKDIFKKMKGKEEVEMEDGTRDRSLKSLREAKQDMDEREEKINLTEMIREDRRDQMRKHLFGVKEELINKKVNVMNNLDTDPKTPLLSERNTVMVENRVFGQDKKNVKSIFSGDNSVLRNKKPKGYSSASILRKC